LSFFLIFTIIFYVGVIQEPTKAAKWQQRGMCGVNAAVLLLTCCGQQVDFEEACAKTVFSSEHGSNIMDVANACGELGLPCDVVKETPESLFRKVSPPFIVHFDDTQYGGSGHFVVAISRDEEGVRIADGGTLQVSSIPFEEFSRLASGYYVVPSANQKRPAFTRWVLFGFGLGLVVFSLVFSNPKKQTQ
jgi:ABC-type bacteriocin/lantibiotic exporter with double-glycine peptidase domain